MKVIWDETKNTLLKETRNISFEDIESAILNDNILDIVPHHNLQQYPNQELLIIKFLGYVYYVPFILTDNEIVLKSIIPSRKLTKKYQKESMMYSKEELEIVDYIEKNMPDSVADKEKKIAKIKSIVGAKYQQRKAISIKVLESDLELLKAKALKDGMPYQTLINSILHKYVTNQFSEKKHAG